MMDPQTLLDETEEQRRARLQWFLDARYGMFIHWGIASQIGRGITSLILEQIPAEEYEQLADTWQPHPDSFRRFAKLAKKAGMRYMVLVSKHVEGFSLWDTKQSDYNSVQRSPGRDLVAEYVEAARAEGMRVGLYYPLTDWRHPDGVICQRDLAARRRFVDFNHNQVRELLSNYGKIDLLWYDCCWPLYDEEMEHVKLNTMVRELQPGIIVNDRSGLKMDYGTPEGNITPAEGGRPWEACMTFNDFWGYTPIDTNYKSAWEVCRMLRQVAAGGGNLLLNIGPGPDGTVPEPCERALLEAGQWLEQYGSSIYDATDSVTNTFPMISGNFTRKGNTIYFHCNRWPGTEVAIGGLACKVKSARIVNGPEVKFVQTACRLQLQGLPEKAPSELATVFEIESEGPPYFDMPPFSCTIDDEKGWEAYWRKVDAK